MILLIFQANDEYYARGSVGTEDIASTAISGPIFVSLLVLPLFITVLSSALIAHRWVLGPVIGGWPLLVLAAIDALTRKPGWIETLAVLVAVAALLAGAAWLTQRLTRKHWRLTTDGSLWGNGNRWYAAVSSDRQWRWDGSMWQSPPRSAESSTTLS